MKPKRKWGVSSIPTPPLPRLQGLLCSNAKGATAWKGPSLRVKWSEFWKDSSVNIVRILQIPQAAGWAMEKRELSWRPWRVSRRKRMGPGLRRKKCLLKWVEKSPPDVGRLKLLCTADGMWDGPTTLENCCRESKLNVYPSTQQFHPWAHIQENSSLIPNIPTLEESPISPSGAWREWSWNIRAVKCYTVIGETKLLLYPTIQMNPSHRLRKRIQTQESARSMVPFLRSLRRGKTNLW